MENPKNFSDRLVLAIGPTPEEIHRTLINSGRDLGKQNLNLEGKIKSHANSLHLALKRLHIYKLIVLALLFCTN